MLSLGKLFRRTGREHFLVIEALLALTWAKLLVQLVPFKRLAPRLGQRESNTPPTISPVDRAHAVEISWAVQAVARHVPLGFVCLPQAIAAKWMLRRRHITSTLYLGVPRSEGSTAIIPHAWLRAGDKIVTGEAAAAGHVAILTLGE